jgi:hypothetical protein
MANDVIDASAGALFTFGTASSLGIADVSVANFAFTDVITSISGYDLTVATVISVLTLATAWFVNDVSYSQLGGEEKTVVALTIALVAVGVVGSLESLVGGSLIVSLAILGIMGGGYWALALES